MNATETISEELNTTDGDRVIFTSDDIGRTLKRLTHEMIEHNHGSDNLVLMGILTRGKPLAERVAKLVESFEDKPVPCGYLDITLYRDDTAQTFKSTQESFIPVDITGKTIVLIDDVIQSGRSIRAALDALNAYGRPASVQLLVLLDRGHRDLPIRPDFVGKNIPTSREERIYVQLNEVDNVDDQVIIKR